MPRHAPAKNPDLTFPGVEFGPLETPWDLQCLLYEGGAAVKVDHLLDEISNGALGEMLLERLPLVVGIHNYIADKVGSGGSREAAKTEIARTRGFFSWMDNNCETVSLETVRELFIDWSGWLNQQVRTGKIGYAHAYGSAVTIAKMLDEVTDSESHLRSLSRVKPPGRAKFPIPVSRETLNIEQSFEFGQALLDISDSLSEEAIFGPLPVKITFRSGQVVEKWLRLDNIAGLKTLAEGVKPSTKEAALAKRRAYEEERTKKTRFPLLNLRLLAEILIFMSQTGMCLADASNLKSGNFAYRSDVDGYKVSRRYKRRRHGEVEFTIYREYRPFFERYLRWREKLFPNTSLMFPFIRFRQGAEHKAPKFKPILELCRQLGIPYICPRKIRKVRQNWLLRRSNDPGVTADMGSHSEDVLLRIYEEPNRQVAIVELARYHQKNNPIADCPGPGVCVDKMPEPVLEKPAEASVPDCTNPAGCLFCFHNRDLHSLDHVWSLTSFRHLKTVELSGYRMLKKAKLPSPVQALIDRVTEKLKAFTEMGSLQRAWVDEAMARVDEGDYHPKWDGFIRLAEN